jgi:hypothetical protein
MTRRRKLQDMSVAQLVERFTELSIDQDIASTSFRKAT